MPRRKVILATGETYHIFNRSLRQAPLFTNKRELDLFLEATRYYLQVKPPVRFSIYRQQKEKYERQLDLTHVLVKIITYCLMPNHYHFILTQLQERGIKTFIHHLTTSYSCYFNLKHHQKGPVFEGKFKAVRIESQEQLIHLNRYLHLNPVTSFLVERPEDYWYSSYKVYIKEAELDFIDPSNIMSDFSQKSYQKFVLDQKDYQRKLENIKHLVFD